MQLRSKGLLHSLPQQLQRSSLPETDHIFRQDQTLHLRQRQDMYRERCHFQVVFVRWRHDIRRCLILCRETETKKSVVSNWKSDSRHADDEHRDFGRDLWLQNPIIEKQYSAWYNFLNWQHWNPCKNYSIFFNCGVTHIETVVKRQTPGKEEFCITREWKKIVRLF
jgi:hypothetical protein